MSKELERLNKRVSLAPSEWDELLKDLSEGIPNAIIISKYNIKKHYLKLIKRNYLGV